MTGRWLVVPLLLLAMTPACGRYGPPVRAEQYRRQAEKAETNGASAPDLLDETVPGDQEFDEGDDE